MCGDKDCSTFRVYTTSDHSATGWWLQSDGSGSNGTTPPAGRAKITAVARNPKQGEMEANKEAFRRQV